MKLAILALAPILALWSCETDDPNQFQGYVEGDFIYIAPTTGGLIDTITVEHGETIAAGDTLFRLDVTNLEAERNSIDAQIDSLQSQLETAQAEYDRINKLNAANAATDEALDQAQTARDTAASQLENAQQSRIQIEHNIQDTMPTAPLDSLVNEVYFSEGEFVNAGQPVLSLLPPKNIKARFFVSQEAVARLAIDSKVTIDCDGCDAPIDATISYIAPNAEYTPPVIYSEQSREKLVFLVEASPDHYSPSLHVGLPITVNLVIDGTLENGQ